MKIARAEQLIPIALGELHSEGEPAAYYPEIVRQLLLHDERYVARRTAMSGLLSKVGIDMPIIPEYPLSPRAGTIYPALARLEQSGVIAGAFEPEPQNGNPHRRRFYRLAQDPDTDNPETQDPGLETDSERAASDKLASREQEIEDARRREIAPWNLTEEENRNPDGTYKFFGD